MKYEYVCCNGSRRLILIYAGWAMDAAPFRGLSRPGYDIAVLWDYRDFGLDWSFTGRYVEICIVAWSLGVYAAAVSTAPIQGKITKRIAVNGTLTPVDRRYGIPPVVFAGTADHLDERNLQKFYRRVCGSMAAYRAFSVNMPSRDIDGLVDELRMFLTPPLFSMPVDKRWDLAVICSDDAIFPPVNQWRAWQGTPIRMLEGAHLPDFQDIIDKHIIDKDMMESRFGRGLVSYDAEAKVQSGVVRRLAKVLAWSAVERRISAPGARVLEIGSGTGALSCELDRLCARSYLEMWDIAGEAPLHGPLRRFCNVDAEIGLTHQPPCSFDLIASASTVQWFNSPTRFLAECARVLAPGGFVVMSTFAKGNLPQIHEATGRSLPLYDSREWRAVIPGTLEVVAMGCYRQEMEFPDAVAAFRHLKLTGVDSLGRGENKLNAVAAVRRFRHDLDGRFRLTYRPIIIILRKNDKR